MASTLFPQTNLTCQQNKQRRAPTLAHLLHSATRHWSSIHHRQFAFPRARILRHRKRAHALRPHEGDADPLH
jgi:hypothetical protein